MAEHSEQHPYSSDFLAALTGIIAQWTAPNFLVSVTAREGIDLDPTSITAISVLGRLGALRPSVLAEHLATGASNVSKVLGRLEAAGLVERRKDERDARATLIQLTPAGDDVAAAFIRAGDGMLEELLDGWTEKERHLLTQLTQRLDISTRAFAARITSTPPQKSPQGSKERTVSE